MAIRIVTGCLLILAGLVHLALGGGYLLSSRDAAQDARLEAGDFSEVAGDLTDQQTLKREQAASAPKVKQAATLRKLTASIALLAMGLAQIVAAILRFVQRQVRVVRAITGLAVLLWVGLVFLIDWSWVTSAAVAMLLLVALLPLLVRTAPQPAA